MKQQSSDFQERPVRKSAFTAEPGKPSEAVAAEQSLKDLELGAERNLKAEELLAERTLKLKQLQAEHDSTKSELAKSQAKNKDLLEAVRYRDRKISKLVPGVSGAGVGKVVGSNTTDHSHLGEVPVEVPAQAKTATKVVTTKAVSPAKKTVAPKR